MLRDEQELLRRIRRPLTLRLLNQAQWLYEVREYARLFGDPENLVNWHQAEHAKFMSILKQWMEQPIRVNFSAFDPIPREERVPRDAPRGTRQSDTTQREKRRARREARRKARALASTSGSG